MFKHIIVAAGTELEAISDAAKQIQRLASGAQVDQFHLDPVRPHEMLDELLHHAADSHADLLILGARKHVIASRMAMLAPCSVLMVPNTSRLSFTRVLVPVDFSSSSSEAVRLGFDLVSESGGTCKVLAVESEDEAWLDWQSNPENLMPKLAVFVNQVSGPRLRENLLVEPIRRSADRLKGEGISLAHGIEGAEIASTIIDVAEREKAGLIVMGTRGRTRSAAVLLGSVTEKVMHWSEIPVLAVKQRDKQMNLFEGLLQRMRRERPTLVSN